MWLRGCPVQLDLNALGTMSADSAEKHAYSPRPGPCNTPDLSSTRVDGTTYYYLLLHTHYAADDSMCAHLSGMYVFAIAS